jgi:hypothetical protein
MKNLKFPIVSDDKSDQYEAGEEGNLTKRPENGKPV